MQASKIMTLLSNKTDVHNLQIEIIRATQKQ